MPTKKTKMLIKGFINLKECFKFGPALIPDLPDLFHHLCMISPVWLIMMLNTKNLFCQSHKLQAIQLKAILKQVTVWWYFYIFGIIKIPRFHSISRDEPNMLPVILSRTSQNIYPSFLIYSYTITCYSLIIIMLIMLSYWKTGCYQCRFLFMISTTVFTFTIIIVLAILVVSSLHTAIIAPNYSYIMLVRKCSIILELFSVKLSPFALKLKLAH